MTTLLLQGSREERIAEWAAQVTGFYTRQRSSGVRTQLRNQAFCALLRTKTAYFRSQNGERLFNPESTTACYNCLLTQRPFGPDGMPVNAEWCRADRGCFKPEI
jgi:hypothetical protein